MPGVENTETDFPISVQIRVESYTLSPSRLQIDHHGRAWVFVWKEDIEFKAAVGIWSGGWAGYEDLM